MRRRRLCWLVLLCACGGCQWFQNEFTFLDRAAPPEPVPQVVQAQ